MPPVNVNPFGSESMAIDGIVIEVVYKARRERREARIGKKRVLHVLLKKVRSEKANNKGTQKNSITDAVMEPAVLYLMSDCEATQLAVKER